MNESLTQVRIYTANDNNVANGAAGNILIQDAQLEQGLAASPYIETTTTSAQAGVLENTPRLNYTTGVANPYLLLEPSRTNQCSQSEYIGSIDWNQGGITRSLVITQTSETNPEGASICWKIQGTASDNQLANNSSTNSGTTITNSVYVKRVSGTSNVLLRNVNNNDTSFSLSVADGWKRIDVTATATSATARFYLNLLDFNDEILVWGAQQEIGSYPTSYIPTYSVSATRAKDVCSKTNTSGIIGQTEGTLFAEIQGYANALSGNSFLSLTESTGNNRLLIGQSSSINQLRVFIDVGTLANGFNYSVTDITQPQKIAIVYSNSGNTIAIYVNGVKETGYTVGDTFNALLTDIVSNNGANGQYAEFNVNELQVYKEALTDAEAITLTTI